MLWRKVQESTFIDATVIRVHGDRELLYLETPDQDEALVVIPCPPKYELPRKGDLVKLELRLELRPDKRRRSWRTYIIRFPGDGLDRDDIHDITDYDFVIRSARIRKGKPMDTKLQCEIGPRKKLRCLPPINQRTVRSEDDRDFST